MKVAYILEEFPAISETFVLNEILEMQRKGVEVQVFACYPRDEERRHETLRGLQRPVIYLYLRVAQWRKILALLYYFIWHPARSLRLWKLNGRRWDYAFRNAFHIARQVAGFGARQIHCHFANTAHDLGLCPSVLSGIPYSFTAHMHDIFFRLPENYRTLFAEASHAVTISHYNKNYLCRELGLPADKIHIVRCGIDRRYFSPQDAAEKNIDILCVARLHPHKGLPFLIEACRRLRDRGHAVRCTIIRRRFGTAGREKVKAGVSSGNRGGQAEGPLVRPGPRGREHLHPGRSRSRRSLNPALCLASA